MKQRTYLMIKPDYMDNKEKIIKFIEEKFKGHILLQKDFVIKTKQLREHYAHLISKPFYPELENYMTSGPVCGMVVEFDYDFISKTRDLIGSTFNPQKGTLREQFYNPKFDPSHNVIHSSDSVKSANKEMTLFFGKKCKLINIEDDGENSI